MEAAQYTGLRLESCIGRLIKGDLCVTEYAGQRLARWSEPTIENTLGELRRLLIELTIRSSMYA